MAFFIFDTFKGTWQVKQIEGATHAKAFWQKTINDYTYGDFHEETYVDNKWGIVTRQILKSRLSRDF